MEEVEVVETVRRGWSGGTGTDKSRGIFKSKCPKAAP